MTLLDRFLRYVKIPTFSKEFTNLHPSTDMQRDLALVLVSELESLGLEITFDQEHCYIYACLKGNVDAPKLGFIAHMDTSDAAYGDAIVPEVIPIYDGGDIIHKNNVVTKVTDYPDLQNHVGKTLIVSDGNTLLGADDKAGIAEIMTMLAYFKEHSDDHGDIYVAFTPDEEIGEGTMFFDYEKFPVHFAYTVDGNSLGEISFENFNAASVHIVINGVSTHTGDAKGLMINSLIVGNALINALPNECPENTDGKQGFYHVSDLEGNVGKTTMNILIRDFDKEKFLQRKNTIHNIVDKLNKHYGNIIELEIKDTYYNMADKMDDCMHLVTNARSVMSNLNVPSITLPIRGGTDGAEITYNGIPCPNLGTGGHNFHSIHEYIALEDMEKVVEILIGIVKIYTKEENIGLKRMKG